MPPPDPELADFVATGNEDAFRVLVERHVRHVHAAAARRLGAHAHLAADVTQQVFTRLAQRARALPPGIVLGGWLYRQSQRLAIDVVRAEESRRRREHQAALHAMKEPDRASSPAEPLPLAAVLDEALAVLSAKDRDALILRFFEDRSLSSIGEALRITPDAAQKRVARALEKLRGLLARRGVMLGAAALGSALTAEAARPAPAGLSAATLTTTALKSATASGTSTGFLTTLLMTHTTSALAGAAAGLLLTGALYWTQTTSPLPAGIAAATPATSPRPAPLAFSDEATLDRLVEEARTVEEIVEALRRVLEGPPDRAATWQAHSLLARLRPEQYLDCLRLAEKRLSEVAHESFLSLLGLVWAEENPEATVRALFASDKGKDTGSTGGALLGGALLNSDRVRVGTGKVEQERSRLSPLSTAFAKWLDRDASAASRWLLDHYMEYPLSFAIDSRGGSFGTATLAQDMAGRLIERAQRENLAAAFQCLAQLPDALLERWQFSFSSLQQKLALSEPAEKRASLEMASEWSERATRPLLAQIMGEAIADELAAWRDDPHLDSGLRFQAGLSLVAALNQRSYSENGGMSGKSVSQTQRLERVQQLAASLGPLDETQLTSLVRAWSLPDQRDDEHEALLTWLRDQPGADAALATGARQLANIDRARALQWADSIHEAPQRDPLLRGLYRQWLDEEPARAREELSRLGLSAGAIATLQTIQP